MSEILPSENNIPNETLPIIYGAIISNSSQFEHQHRYGIMDVTPKTFFEKILENFNTIFLFLFFPFKYLIGNDASGSASILERTPLFKKFVWIILLVIIAYGLYYIAKTFHFKQKEYISSSIWYWIIMFVIIISIIEIKQKTL
jgi:hypothetical protein